MGGWVGGTWVRLHSITHSIDVDYRQNTSIRQHLTMTSAHIRTCVRICTRACVCVARMSGFGWVGVGCVLVRSGGPRWI